MVLRWLAIVSIVGAAGCGGGPATAPSSAGNPSSPSRSGTTGKGVQFVGFDASSRLIEAIRAGQLHGTVVQNPYRMGQLGVKTLVAHLQKRPTEPQISTGEAMITPENVDSTEMSALVNPPKASNSQDATVGGTNSKTFRIMVIPKGTTHEFWQTIHAGASKAAKNSGMSN